MENQINENFDRIYLPEFLQNIGGNPEFEWITSYDEAVRTFFSTYE